MSTPPPPDAVRHSVTVVLVTHDGERWLPQVLPAAVAQRRADWGVTLDIVARRAGLGFLPVQDEHYDFVVPKSRATRSGVIALKALLLEPRIREALARLGMKV